MKKCTNCGRMVHEQLADCPACGVGLPVANPVHVSPHVGGPAPATATATAVAPAVPAVQTAGPAPDFDGMPLPDHVQMGEYAGFWIRLGAFMLDSLIMFSPSWILNGVINANANTASPGLMVLLLLTYAYAFGFWCFNNVYLQAARGATVGKRICGLVVLNPDGETMSVGTAILRELFKSTISRWACMLGYIMQAFDDEGQSWHDKVAGTYVYYA